MEHLPPDAPVTARADTGRPVPGSGADAAELLGVEVEQAARRGELVAEGRHRGRRRSLETEAADGPVDGRGRRPQGRGDPVGSPAGGADASPRSAAPRGPGDAAVSGLAERSGRRVHPAHGPPAQQPPVVTATADPEGETGGADGQAGLDGPEDLRPTAWCQAGVGVTMPSEEPSQVIELVSALNLAGDGRRTIWLQWTEGVPLGFVRTTMDSRRNPARPGRVAGEGTLSPSRTSHERTSRHGPRRPRQPGA